MTVWLQRTLWLSIALSSTPAFAGLCDYRPSEIIGEASTAVAGLGAAGVAAVGTGMKVAGIYAITNATTGAVMLGSTIAGASAAGTTGILAGTAGAIGTAGAFAMTPVVLTTAAVGAGVIGLAEGGCYVTRKWPVLVSRFRR